MIIDVSSADVVTVYRAVVGMVTPRELADFALTRREAVHA